MALQVRESQREQERERAREREILTDSQREPERAKKSQRETQVVDIQLDAEAGIFLMWHFFHK